MINSNKSGLALILFRLSSRDLTSYSGALFVLERRQSIATMIWTVRLGASAKYRHDDLEHLETISQVRQLS